MPRDWAAGNTHGTATKRRESCDSIESSAGVVLVGDLGIVARGASDDGDGQRRPLRGRDYGLVQAVRVAVVQATPAAAWR